MFSYVDKSIRHLLEDAGTLVTLDEHSQVVESLSPDAFLSVLGPVPIPRLIGDVEVMLEW